MKTAGVIRSESGVSLVSTLIAVGLFALSAAATAGLAEMQSRWTRHIRAKRDVLQLRRDIEMAINNATTCQSSTLGTKVNGKKEVGLGQLHLDPVASPGARTLMVGEPIEPGSPVRIAGISLKNVTDLGGNKSYTDLEVEYLPVVDGGPALAPSRFPGVVLRTAVNGDVLDCVTTGGGSVAKACPQGQIMSGFDAQGEPMCSSAGIVNATGPDGSEYVVVPGNGVTFNVGSLMGDVTVVVSSQTVVKKMHSLMGDVIIDPKPPKKVPVADGAIKVAPNGNGYSVSIMNDIKVDLTQPVPAPQ